MVSEQDDLLTLLHEAGHVLGRGIHLRLAVGFPEAEKPRDGFSLRCTMCSSVTLLLTDPCDEVTFDTAILGGITVEHERADSSGALRKIEHILARHAHVARLDKCIAQSLGIFATGGNTHMAPARPDDVCVAPCVQKAGVRIATRDSTSVLATGDAERCVHVGHSVGDDCASGRDDACVGGESISECAESDRALRLHVLVSVTFVSEHVLRCPCDDIIDTLCEH